MFGVQKERPAYWYTLPFSAAWRFLTRASSETAVKTVSIFSTSNEAAIPMGCGNTVALPLRATPCRASLHQLYALMPSLSTAGELYWTSPAFSSSESLESRSLALASAGWVLSV